MKKLISFIMCLFVSVSVYAICRSNMLSIFPSGQTIKQNSVFILDGYANSQDIILNLNTKHNIYLLSGNKKIKLIVSEIYVGQYRLTQAMLKPETELEAGLEYTMHIDSLPVRERFNRYNNVTKEYEPVTYKVIAGRDNEKPQLSQKPSVVNKTFVYFACGPSIHVVFSNPATDSSEIIVKTTVKNLKSGKETTYFIEPNGDKIEVGRGMCSGAFNFDDSNDYEVEFSFMDGCGNLKKWKGKRIKFSKPTKRTG